MFKVGCPILDFFKLVLRVFFNFVLDIIYDNDRFF